MRTSCLILLLLCALGLKAQTDFKVRREPDRPVRKFVVADMETRVPIRNAVVTTKDGYRDSSNWRGIVRIPTDFDTIMVSHHGYLAEVIAKKDAKDSTYLIPSDKSLRQITVWGKDKSGRQMQAFGPGFDRAIAEGSAYAPAGIIHFELAKMLDGRGRRDAKHLKKVRQKFDEMDKYSDDPIVNAYMKAQEEEKRKKQWEEGTPDE